MNVTHTHKTTQATKYTNNLIYIRTYHPYKSSHPCKHKIKGTTKIHNKQNKTHHTKTTKNAITNTKNTPYYKEPTIAKKSQTIPKNYKTFYKNRTQNIKNPTPNHNLARPTGLAQKKKEEKRNKNIITTYQPPIIPNQSHNSPLKTHDTNNTNIQHKYKQPNTIQPNEHQKTTKQTNKATRTQLKHNHDHSRKHKESRKNPTRPHLPTLNKNKKIYTKHIHKYNNPYQQKNTNHKTSKTLKPNQ